MFGLAYPKLRANKIERWGYLHYCLEAGGFFLLAGYGYLLFNRDE
jgi:hypothetical protein